MRFAYLIEPPFNYVDRSGEVVGCDVELARYVCAALGEPRFEPVETEFADLLPGLKAGRWEMTTGLFATSARLRMARFTRPIWALPDGLLVAKGNPLGLKGYQSIAVRPTTRLAVIQDQFQHQTALELGVREAQIEQFETYAEAAEAVRLGRADAYASVFRAHTGFLEQSPSTSLEGFPISPDEKPPAYGAFALSLDDDTLVAEIDQILADYLGSHSHREMMTGYGFSQEEVDLIATY